ncbi:MAG: hypothetical protein M1837_003009 [Sclerophora amabilis]|nr:MAG: hypothetical protein M1837_003009 [Sclerophora amabilis]
MATVNHGVIGRKREEALMVVTASSDSAENIHKVDSTERCRNVTGSNAHFTSLNF